MEPTNLYIIILSVFTIVIGYDIYSWARGRTLATPEIKLTRFRSTVHFTLFVTGTVLTLASIAFHINIFNYSPPLEYARVKEITLKNFNGFKRPHQTLDGGNEFAFIITSIEWAKNENEVEVISYFHPSRSYVFNENLVDKLLLQHELYHFHITEYFARQIRKDILDSKVVPSEETIKEYFKTYRMLENVMQYEYDDQTYHGYILKEQKQWQQKVDSLLFSHQKYSETKVLFKKVPL